MGSACFPRWRFWTCFDGVGRVSGVASGSAALAQRFPSFTGVSDTSERVSGFDLGWATTRAVTLDLETSAGGAGAAFAAVLFAANFAFRLAERFAPSSSSSVASSGQ